MRPWWLFGLLGLTASPARADESGSQGGVRPGWVGAFATGFVGDGLRFNNPYRLSTVLGSDARSVSRTAAYADFGGAVTLGDPSSLAYGVALRASFALEGVQQAVLTPSVVLLRRWQRWGAYGRAGVATVLTPDATWGAEGAVGGLWFASAGAGVAAEIVGDLFYGAGTEEVATPAYPVLSAQVGLWLSFEAMP